MAAMISEEFGVLIRVLSPLVHPSHVVTLMLHHPEPPKLPLSTGKNQTRFLSAHSARVDPRRRPFVGERGRRSVRFDFKDQMTYDSARRILIRERNRPPADIQKPMGTLTPGTATG